MAYLITVADLTTHLYQEIMDEISQLDSAIVQAAVDRAISQAKGYCSRYDLVKIFGNVSTNPTVEDHQLKGIVKDLAVWHFIQLCNTSIDMARAQAAYEYAVQWLKDVQKGMVVPDGWLYRDTTLDTAPAEGTDVTYSSNTKRTNHF